MNEDGSEDSGWLRRGVEGPAFFELNIHVLKFPSALLMPIVIHNIPCIPLSKNVIKSHLINLIVSTYQII